MYFILYLEILCYYYLLMSNDAENDDDLLFDSPLPEKDSQQKTVVERDYPPFIKDLRDHFSTSLRGTSSSNNLYLTQWLKNEEKVLRHPNYALLIKSGVSHTKIISLFQPPSCYELHVVIPRLTNSIFNLRQKLLLLEMCADFFPEDAFVINYFSSIVRHSLKKKCLKNEQILEKAITLVRSSTERGDLHSSVTYASLTRNAYYYFRKNREGKKTQEMKEEMRYAMHLIRKHIYMHTPAATLFGVLAKEFNDKIAQKEAVEALFFHGNKEELGFDQINTLVILLNATGKTKHARVCLGQYWQLYQHEERIRCYWHAMAVSYLREGNYAKALTMLIDGEGKMKFPNDLHCRTTLNTAYDALVKSDVDFRQAPK